MFLYIELNYIASSKWFRSIERLISEKQNNRESAEGARLPKEAMLLGDIFKFTRFLDILLVLFLGEQHKLTSDLQERKFENNPNNKVLC